jgi:cysteine desulfurase/selenocysteine lyase
MSTSSPLEGSPIDLEALTQLANQFFSGQGGAGLPSGPESPITPDGGLHAAPTGGASIGAFDQPDFGRALTPQAVPLADAAPDPGSGGGPVGQALVSGPAAPGGNLPFTAPPSFAAGVPPAPASAPAPLSPLSPSLGGILPLGEVDPAQFGLPSQEQLRALLAPATAAAPGGGAAPSAPFYFLDYAPGLSGPDQAAPQPGQWAAAQPAVRPPFDIQIVRRDFPILSERINGRELVWLDNAATTQKPRPVLDRLRNYYEHENSNVHRGAHPLAARATDAYEAAREKVRGFLNAGNVEEIVFVRGATEAINLVAQSWGRANIGEGDEIVLSHLEHHANIVPWQQLALEKGAKLRVIPVDDDGQIILSALGGLLNARTKLVAVTQVSNALGTITPAKAIAAAAHAAGAKVLIDGAQAVSHQRVDVRDLDADFYVFSGHKVFAPTGIGVLYGKRDLLNAMPPWQSGGNMIKDVTFERSTFHPAPGRFEAGTANIGGAVGLGAAIDYVNQIGMDVIGRYEHQLLLYATRLLERIPGLRIVGTAPDKAGVLSFVLDGLKTEDVGAALGREGIAVRSGHHCAQPILRRFGLEATVRPSLAFYNHCGDIDALVAAVTRIGAGRRPS